MTDPANLRTIYTVTSDPPQGNAHKAIENARGMSAFIRSDVPLRPQQDIPLDQLEQIFGTAAIGHFPTFRLKATTNPLDAGRLALESV